MVFVEFVGCLALVLFFFCASAVVVFRWNEVWHMKKARSPPGTMGWPVVGETTEFLKQGPDFMSKQQARYGNLFKSHILGCPTVISMDPDMNRYIVLNEKEGLVPGYPQSMIDILGKQNIAAVHGPAHKKLRGVINALVNPNMMRDQIIPKINEFTDSFLANWTGQIIDIQEKTKQMAFLLSIKMLLGVEKSPLSEIFMPEFYKLVSGTLSLPIDLPTTNYRRGLKARNTITSMLREIIKGRRAAAAAAAAAADDDAVHNDMLEVLLGASASARGQQLNDEQIIDLIIIFMYSGFETVSTTSMMAVKYLSQNPNALKHLRKEHTDIRKNKSPEDRAIDWNDIKSMTFTRAVILETMRLATVVNGVLRKTTHDVELNGYIIPKGWRIYVYTREINYDSSLYLDPLVFNPWRWVESNLESQKHFMLFGAGNRSCPGKESGIVEISTFLHYLVTRYRWEEFEGEALQTFPRILAPNGLHIKVWDYE